MSLKWILKKHKKIKKLCAKCVEREDKMRNIYDSRDLVVIAELEHKYVLEIDNFKDQLHRKNQLVEVLRNKVRELKGVKQ